MALNESRVQVFAGDKADAELVRRLLHGAYPQVRACIDPTRFAIEFGQFRPQVLVLAFEHLDDAERHYLGLYRDCAHVHATPHRTLLLCTEDEVNRAYEMCLKGGFDDYAMFWPTGRDEPRLPMSVATSLRALESSQAAGALTLMAQLGRQLALGVATTRQVLSTLEDAQTRTGIALDAFSSRMVENGLDDAVVVRNAEGVQREISRLNAEILQLPLAQAAKAMQPLRRWMARLGTELAPPLEVARALAESATHLQPLVLVVDDDELTRNLLTQVLESANYEVAAVASAAEALSLLQKRRPRLILMDVVMPDIDGIDATRRLKAIEAYAGIPVIMLTGKAEKQVIIDGLGAGAAGFVVKPVERDVLLQKVADKLGS